MLRTHTCGALGEAEAGSSVVLGGWVDRVRDQGGIVFVDLRDRYGITQIIFDRDDSEALVAQAHGLHHEYVVSVTGNVELRPDGRKNDNLATGLIEVRATELTVLNASQTPPFPLEEEKACKVSEDLRMKYRYLDLRRASMQENLVRRFAMSQAIRNTMQDLGFIEVETPIMTKSTPEGARDYLVPNRITPGTFYALPQAPQQYKQILMVAGLDRYFQVARCFRDEDLRADRQPEFTQIDLEMSFVEKEDIYDVVDQILASAYAAAGHGTLELPLPRMTWEEAMDNYGSDKPDLRFDWKLNDLSDLFANSKFKVFQSVVSGGNVVKAFNAKGRGAIPIRLIDEWTELAKKHGMGGLAYIRVQEDGTWKSPIVKFFSEEEKAGLQERLAVEPGDLILFAASERHTANDFLGKIRVFAAELDDSVIDAGKWCYTWVTEFPLFETNTEGRLVPVHHPFTSCHPDDLELLKTDPAKARSVAYDVVLNGVELGSGSIRIHDPKIQSDMFELLKISEEEKKDRFGHLLEALAYGAPPHGGFAVGFDRLTALMVDGETIRDVIAFPKNHRGIDLMMDAPGKVDAKQLKDVHIELSLPELDEE